MSSKLYIVAIELIISLICPSYGSLLTRLNRQLLQVNINDKLCIDYGKHPVDGVADWLTSYSGDYTVISQFGGKPVYKMTTCLYQYCYNGATLYSNFGSWSFEDGDFSLTSSDPFCMSNTNTPKDCTSWWGGRNPTIKECGNTPVSTSTTTSTQQPISSLATSSISKQILEKHNYYRQQVAAGNIYDNSILPKATNMPQLEWDSKLEAIAKEWANRCVFEHRLSSDGQQRYCKELGISNCGFEYQIGENLAMGNLVEDAVKAWFDEYKGWKWSRVNDANWRDIGHLTQIVWDKTTKIGCAFKSDCPNNLSNFLVCNYHSAGNMIGQYAYSSNSNNN
eukprot:390770_1